jgi:hypothetical protein
MEKPTHENSEGELERLGRSFKEALSCGRLAQAARDIVAMLKAMVRERSPVKAQRAALAFLAHGGSLDALRAALYDLVLRDRFTRPSFQGLGVSLAVAACDEAMALPERDRIWPICALVRMLSSEVREHSREGLVLQARRLVEQGLPPKTRL